MSMNTVNIIKSWLRLAPSLALLIAFSLSGCLCVDDNNFFGFPDGGVDAGPPPAPEPPVFPLKANDQVILSGVGGRAEGCGAAEGGCDRVLRATYTINDVFLDENTNRWTINADYLYEMQVTVIEAAAMGQLFLSRTAPFGDLTEGASDSDTADFDADKAPTDGLTANGFPFFHFENEYATREDSAYRAASTEFQDRILQIDPDANIENQAAEAKIEAYFRDDLGVNTMLHKIRVDYHPMGFVCGWDERLVPWSDDMGRNEADFSGLGIDLAAVFIDPVQIIRDDTRYRCSCFQRTCANTMDTTMCLDPYDPDGGEVPCECLQGDAPDTCD
jgi:hypothetical protein